MLQRRFLGWVRSSRLWGVLSGGRENSQMRSTRLWEGLSGLGGSCCKEDSWGGEHQAVGRTQDEKQHLRSITGFASPGPVNLR